MKQKIRVLVVDDDETFRELLDNTLRKEGFETTVAANGKDAKSIVALQDFDVVISDIRMSPVNGIELFHFVRQTRPQLPVILMTGFAEISETQEAHAFGANGFLPKPFKREELLAALNAAAGTQPAATDAATEQTDADFCKLPIEEFVTGRQVKFDIHVKLGENKFVKVAHQGEDLDLQRVHAYKAKGINFLYLRKNDFREYVGFNVKLLRALKETPAVSHEKRLRLVKHAGEIILERLHADQVDKEALDAAKSVVESTLSAISDLSKLLELLDLMHSSPNHLYAHSIVTSTVAVMLARQVQWHAQSNLFKIATGALFHDIGLREIPAEVLSKPRQNLTPEEVRLFESHPMRGVEILAQIPGLPNEVLQITVQHHENCTGTGYPYGLVKNSIHPFSRLIAVADTFTNFIVNTPHTQALPVPDALQLVLTTYGHGLDSTFLGALSRVFGQKS